MGKRLRDIFETLCVLGNLLTDLRALVLLDITVSSGVLDITVSSGVLDIMVSSGVLDIIVSSGERWSVEQFVQPPKHSVQPTACVLSELREPGGKRTSPPRAGRVEEYPEGTPPL